MIELDNVLRESRLIAINETKQNIENIIDSIFELKDNDANLAQMEKDLLVEAAGKLDAVKYLICIRRAEL